VGPQLLQGAEGVDRAGETGEGDELEERLVELARRDARGERPADPPAERRLPAPGAGGADARESDDP
jgi:hypothetical protein